MALEHKFEIEEQEGCKEIYFVDSTGDYDVTLNPTGYGTPNLGSDAIVAVQVIITPYGDAVGYTFDFTVVTNIITVATVTAPDGTVTDILADLVSTAWPWIVDVNPLIIIGDYLGFGTDSEITSGGFNIEYIIDEGAEQFSFDEDHLIACQVCCCVRNAAADLEATNCECQAEKLNNAINAQIFFDAAVWATEGGEIDKGVANLAMAKKLCEGKCTNC